MPLPGRSTRVNFPPLCAKKMSGLQTGTNIAPLFKTAHFQFCVAVEIPELVTEARAGKWAGLLTLNVDTWVVGRKLFKMGLRKRGKKSPFPS